MDTVALILDGLRVILGFLILLFMPGFALSLAIFPRISDLGISDRLVYSLVLSIVSDIVFVVFMGVVPWLEPTPENLALVVCVFSDIVFMFWLGEWWYLNRRKKKHSGLRTPLRSAKDLTDVENRLQVESIRKLQKNILRDLTMYDVTSDSCRSSQKNIEHIRIPKNADVNKKLSEAEEELKDLNWLYD